MLEQVLGQSEDLQHFATLVKVGWVALLEARSPRARPSCHHLVWVRKAEESTK